VVRILSLSRIEKEIRISFDVDSNDCQLGKKLSVLPAAGRNHTPWAGLVGPRGVWAGEDCMLLSTYKTCCA
jgi:hypothetical protein